MYIQTIGTRDRARHVASRRICPHIHVLCMPACVPMSAHPRSGSPHDDLHRSSIYDNRGHVEVDRTAIISERERANLVVQLARFFYIYIYVLVISPLGVMPEGEGL